MKDFKSTQPMGTLKSSRYTSFGFFNLSELNLGFLDVKLIKSYTNYW